ncbi:hypothetical protein MHU86_17265 [Fragilaria crotonensis]|nr:hypothetical protein MHU86_17265 [Fragilaria crotonensis]
MEQGFNIINGRNVRSKGCTAASTMYAQTTRGAAATAATAAAIAAAAGAGADNQGANLDALLMTNPVTLMPNPRSRYHDLWNEHLHGVGGGRKPARLFSETEQVQVKYKKLRQMVICDVIRNLVSLGHSLQWAIGMNHNVYGPQTSVTLIITTRLWRDKDNGTLNPNLQIKVIRYNANDACDGFCDLGILNVAAISLP